MKVHTRRQRARRWRGAVAIAALALAAGLMLPAVAKTQAAYQLAPKLKMKTIRLPTGPQEIRILKLSPGAVPDISPGAQQFPMRAKVSTMSAALGALAGVNGDFGTQADQPVHTLMIDGELWTSGLQPGSALAWSADGTQAYVGQPDLKMMASHRKHRMHIYSWNALQGPTAVSAYTSRGGILAPPPGVASPTSSDPYFCEARLVPLSGLRWKNTSRAGIVRTYKVDAQPQPCLQTPLSIGSTAGSVVLAAQFTAGTRNKVRALSVGDRMKITWTFGGWPNITDVMGGAQILVQDGQNVAPGWHSGAPYILNYNPRTTAGITQGCSDQDPLTKCAMRILTVDGRQTSTNWSKGLRLPAVANQLMKVGVWNALNMDGGGSTDTWVSQQDATYCQLYPAVGGCVVNRPITSSAGGERSIRTALVVLPGADTGTPAGLG